ncbi:MAG: metal ABC transporter permease [Verrucomicrobiae bacterium]|nr:metal ABC transporter permease [Verrucomicrobiae bacterium]
MKILEIFSPNFLFANALCASLLMGLCVPLIGRHLVFGRSILLGLALPQISLAGVAFVFWGAAMGWGWCHGLQTEFSRALAGSLLFALPTLAALALTILQRGELTESWLAMAFLAAMSFTQLLLSHNGVGETYIEDLFHGRLLLIDDAAFRVFAAILPSAALAALAFRKRFLLVLTGRDFAAVCGIHLPAWHLALALLNGLVIGLCVAIVGPLVTFGYLVLPVVGAARLATSVRTHAVWSSGFGVLMGLAGFLASYHWDLPLGAAVVAAGCAGVGIIQTVRYGLGFLQPSIKNSLSIKL